MIFCHTEKAIISHLSTLAIVDTRNSALKIKTNKLFVEHLHAILSRKKDYIMNY